MGEQERADGLTTFPHKTVADLICYMPHPENRKSLETFRIWFESQNGPTDMTRYYTCMWPSELQTRLIAIAPQRYYEGLPPFVQDYMKKQIEHAAKIGRIDDLPELHLQLFLTKYFGTDGRSR
jgi:hypothetical protein